MSKDLGDIGELRFLLEAKKKGYKVSTPYSSHSKYDFILDNNTDLYKIQVKSTFQKDGNRDRYKILVSSGRNTKTMYNINDVDYFVIYIQPIDAVYIIPSCDIDTKTISIYPDKKNHILNKYLERWDLLN